jgi:hypothetical protein
VNRKNFTYVFEKAFFENSKYKDSATSWVIISYVIVLNYIQGIYFVGRRLVYEKGRKENLYGI